MRVCALVAAAVLLVGCVASSQAQEKGSWRAASKTASAITGDVGFTGDKILINFATFTIAKTRELTPAEVDALFEGETPGGAGNLYRLNIPGSTLFVHKNKLCASDDTQWVATYVVGKNLRLAFFSGAKTPVLSPEALAATSDLCGTYAYVR